MSVGGSWLSKVKLRVDYTQRTSNQSSQMEKEVERVSGPPIYLERGEWCPEKITKNIEGLEIGLQYQH